MSLIHQPDIGDGIVGGCFDADTADVPDREVRDGPRQDGSLAARGGLVLRDQQATKKQRQAGQHRAFGCN